jgi:hypothetical protein
MGFPTDPGPGIYPINNPNSTDGMYIVKSLRSMDVYETIYIENGTGLRATRIGLVQGREMELTVVDDTSLLPPTYNTQIHLTDPSSNTLMIFSVIDNSYNTARKQEGERVMRVVFDTLIEGAGTIPPIS